MTLEMGKTAHQRAATHASYIGGRCLFSFVAATLHGLYEFGGTYGGYEDEDGLVDEVSLREQAQTEVDEDEVLGELSQTGEYVFARPLRASRHVVVRVVLESNAAEEERYDAYSARK